MVKLLDEKDENVTTFEKLPDGEYRVKGIQIFSTDSSTGKYILKADSYGNLVCRFRFDLGTTEQGPPMQLSLGEMAMLANAFSVTNLSTNAPDESEVGNHHAYLHEIEDKIYKANKWVTASVYNGWVRNVSGMNVPPDKEFYFMMTDIPSKPGIPPSPIKGKGDSPSFFNIELTILGGEGGSETPLKGAKVKESLSYMLEPNNNGEIEFIQDPDGKLNFKSKILSRALRLTAPGVETFIDIDGNILPYWLKEVKKSQQILKGKWQKSKNGKVFLNWFEVEPVYHFEVKNKPATNGKHEKEINWDEKARELFIKVLEIRLGKSATKAPFVLNDEAVAEARPWVIAAKEKGKVKNSDTKNFVLEEIRAILAEVNDPRLNEIKDELRTMDNAQVFENAFKEEEEYSETPF
jgi:hypothetical protein